MQNAAEVQKNPQSGQNQQDVTDQVKSTVLGKSDYRWFFTCILDVARHVKLCTGSKREDVYYEIANDIETRAQFGEKKYGTRLKTFNGRDCLLDLYQELLDALEYAKQAEMEGRL